MKSKRRRAVSTRPRYSLDYAGLVRKLDVSELRELLHILGGELRAGRAAARTQERQRLEKEVRRGMSKNFPDRIHRAKSYLLNVLGINPRVLVCELRDELTSKSEKHLLERQSSTFATTEEWTAIDEILKSRNRPPGASFLVELPPWDQPLKICGPSRSSGRIVCERDIERDPRFRAAEQLQAMLEAIFNDSRTSLSTGILTDLLNGRGQ